MHDVSKWQEGDLERIRQAAEKENTSIDYKSSAALNFGDSTPLKGRRGTIGDKHREDLIRDVVAMANAEGGTIIYGIVEKSGGFPDYIDDGIDPKDTNADRIEQIILTNIHPRVEGIVIRPIELKARNKGTYAYAIQIPKASKNAPHQADDKIYYKRYDATKLAMDDHEIRDMMGRSLEFGRKFGIAWDLLVEIRRLVAAAIERSKIGEGQYLPRRNLAISVLVSLRSSGVAIMALPRPLQIDAARLITAIDEYNSVIEVNDPGQLESARLTKKTRDLLNEIIKLGDEIRIGLLDILNEGEE